MYLNQKDTQLAQCEEVSRADRIRGAYENKIRFYSPPEKMFEVFSTIKTEDGELRMSYGDFLRALTPYVYTSLPDSPDEYLKENTPKILLIVDADNDGSISFTEFFFFLLLLQTPHGLMRKLFRKYPNKQMSQEDFSKEMTALRKKSTTGIK